MNILVNVILLAAALGSVFFVAGLANVPGRVRFSVLTIGPSFMLAFLLHVSWPQHLDWGLAAIGISVIATAVTGFHFTQTAKLSKRQRAQLFKRFAIIFAVSAATVIMAVWLIVRSGERIVDTSAPPAMTPPTSGTVAPSQSTQQAIDNFNRLGHGNE